ncbi:uncharacterized protein LOC107048120 [Diachasma alloeum]|uniref:uncharacterized protein LOC107048120 n=1 Tax=Diachasma alloeum TaxID=454923 RepID=UPI0007382BBF|nr:uncharacterized protein LOC107048120 [Diachasma alloeum]
MAEFESNRCYACKKLFCCVDCCTNHIRSKHPGRESECPLCRSELLIVRNFDNSHFMCHVVINHLPLQCRTCGDLFECSADLKSLGTCSRRLSKRKDTVNEGHSVVAHGPSPLTQTPLNPVNQSKGYSIEGDYNANFESLTSPPEFTRHTSTPMHIGLSRKTSSIVFKPPRSPSFSLKTPKTPTLLPQGANKGGEANEDSKSVYSKTDTPHIQKKQSSRDSNLQELLEQSESVYLSFSPSTRRDTSEKPSLKSILLSRSPVESLEPPRDRMLELEGTSADMDLTDPQGSTSLSLHQANQEVKTPLDGVFKLPAEARDSGKRVRFSDQFEMKEEREMSLSKSCVSGTEEFFEARQSLSEFTVINPDSSPGGTDPGEENVKPSSIFRPLNDLSLVKYEEDEENRGNKENIENTNIEKGIPTSEKQSEGEKFVSTKVSETSRVVMMVLVEKTGASGTVDLAPLIDSGLRTLESVTTSMNSGQQGASSSGETSHGQKKFVVSVDTYKSVSTIEHYRKPSSEESDQRKRPEKSEGGGLFSAVANAVRTAFKNISEAVSTRPVMGEEQARQPIPTIKIDPPEEGPTNPARPLKRSREALVSFDATEATETDTDESDNDIRSPEQKRHRGWYRQIRGREPIARMRSGSVLLNRGISNETQCFQQGSLSVGDTILPLPSRAHQSTQTDH